VPIEEEEEELILVRRASAVEEELNEPHYYCISPCSQSLHVTEGGAMMPLSTSLLQKINATMDHLYQIPLI
jgi:hypothetical protein